MSEFLKKLTETYPDKSEPCQGSRSISSAFPRPATQREIEAYTGRRSATTWQIEEVLLGAQHDLNKDSAPTQTDVPKYNCIEQLMAVEIVTDTLRQILEQLIIYATCKKKQNKSRFNSSLENVKNRLRSYYLQHLSRAFDLHTRIAGEPPNVSEEKWVENLVLMLIALNLEKRHVKPVKGKIKHEILYRELTSNPTTFLPSSTAD
jgi:hypothetical protein